MGLQGFAKVCNGLQDYATGQECKGLQGYQGFAGGRDARVCKGLQSIGTFIDSFNSLI